MLIKKLIKIRSIIQRLFYRDTLKIIEAALYQIMMQNRFLLKRLSDETLLITLGHQYPQEGEPVNFNIN